MIPCSPRSKPSALHQLLRGQSRQHADPAKRRRVRPAGRSSAPIPTGIRRSSCSTSSAPGGLTSRVALEVREERGLAYSVLGLARLIRCRHTGVILGQVGSQNAHGRPGAIDLIRGEWKRMRDEGPTAQELASAKTYLTGSFPLGLDSTGRIAGILISIQFDHLGIDYLDKRDALINKVTLADAKRVAARLLSPDNAVFRRWSAQPQEIWPERELVGDSGHQGVPADGVTTQDIAGCLAGKIGRSRSRSPDELDAMLARADGTRARDAAPYPPQGRQPAVAAAAPSGARTTSSPLKRVLKGFRAGPRQRFRDVIVLGTGGSDRASADRRSTRSPISRRRRRASISWTISIRRRSPSPCSRRSIRRAPASSRSRNPAAPARR